MKASDICVGDWISMGNPIDDKLIPVKIENIYGEEINCKTGHTNDDVPTILSGKWLRYAQPIELTEGILVKNGFHTYGESYFIPEDKCNAHVRIGFHKRETVVDLHRHGAFSVQISCKPGKLYIHILQHLLRLVGIEKELEL